MRKENDLLETLKFRLSESSIFQGAIEVIAAGNSVVLDGCIGSSKSFFSATLYEKFQRPLLVVVPNVSSVERVVSDLLFFTNAPVLPYPFLSLANKGEEEVFSSDDVDFGKRLRVLRELNNFSSLNNRSNLYSSNLFTRPPVVVASLSALLQSVPSRSKINGFTITLNVGDEFGRDSLRNCLKDFGFDETTSVEYSGEFSVRGDIVDVFPVELDRPVRIEFFGDEIESIRFFDVTDQRSLSNRDSVDISRLKSTDCETVERFFDYLPSETIVLLYETDSIITETAQLLASQRQNTDNEFTVSDAMNALYRLPTVHLTTVATGSEVASEKFCPNFFSIERLQGELNQVEANLDKLDDAVLVGVVCSSDIEALRLKETFAHTKPARNDNLRFIEGALYEGFEWRDGNFILVGSDQLFGRVVSLRKKNPTSQKLRKTIDSFLELKPGELVIHVDYGLARFIGIEELQKANQREDHLKLAFAKSAYLYVPVSQIGKIQRYIGAGRAKATLASISGKSWQNQKKKVREAVWELALEMAQLQAVRETLEGIAFPEDGSWQLDFESRFPFQETEDQIAAVEAVKKDMERSRPMDRLLCGDVGFGKTEIAMRAAFKAVEAGYQVAVLAPTTILVEQHYRTFSQRMSNFPIRIVSLSRFSKKKEQAEIIKELKEGGYDIVIGTHRIIQKDVQFKKLGLVVVDEEQKFGVADKEKLKKFHSTVDVLTMTATPIPRTLHFSLLGIRDISDLKTPPADRLPVETRVARFNDEMIRNAVMRELNRGGQIYYLHNRVGDIEERAAQLRRIVPEARIDVAHAQMDVDELEVKMSKFVRSEIDLLVSTTIIESGLDIPNANTIFIDDANRFGLAELHQLRGRVGREKRQAYCYLLVAPNKTLSSQEAKRLRALEEYDKLGSGFQIAMRDLEIRGAGNILGIEQSGHIATIGYEMYCDFLDAAVRALKKQPQKKYIDVEVDLPGTAVLSDEYIPDQLAKIDFYRRRDRITEPAEVVELRNELLDRFGTLPIEAERLFTITQIKIAAFQYRIKRIQLVHLDKKTLSFSFSSTHLKYQFQRDLERRGVSLLLVDEENGITKGYIALDKTLLGVKGEIKIDELYSFVLSLFYEKDEQIVRKNQPRQKPKKAATLKKSSVQTKPRETTKGKVSEAPLGDALKRLKDKRRWNKDKQ